MIKRIADKIRYADVNTFTSDFGINIRRKFYKLISFVYYIVITFYYKKKIIIDKSVKLDKNKVYIFAPNHSFYFDGAAIGACIDKAVYSLFGGTEQLYLDIRFLFAWVAGMIYIDRFDKKSRIDSYAKMNRVLKSGTSILIFPEGIWNNSESRLCQKLFAGVYNLALENKVEVVPISVFNEMSSRDIHISYGEPLKLYDFDKDKGLQMLRDTLSTMLYEQIENYSTPFVREEIAGDIHFDYMEQRMKEYSEAKWKSDYCWDDELFEYKAGDVDLEDVWNDIDKVNINVDNANIFGDILVELEKRKKYNFKNYMNENYRKKY